MERFQSLLKNPTGNMTELEKMRHDAGKRLREQIQKLVESDDFLVMCTTRQAYYVFHLDFANRKRYQ